MSGYVRYNARGEVRMDYYTFKALPFQKVWDTMTTNRRLRPRESGGKVREFK